jgi:hypothetical protein
MSERSYTPGPWTCGFSHWGRWQIDSSKNEAGVSFHIAELASYAGLGGGEKKLNDQQQANARLIAAAPTMLEALRAVEFDVRGRCSACFGWDASSENDHKHADNCIVASAIAQATGAS